MDMGSAVGGINWLSVFVAAVSSFMIGGVWYGPLFGRAWMDAFNLTEEDLAKRNLPVVFGVSLLLALIASINLEMFIGAEATLSFGLFAGFAAGLGWVATFLGIIYLFEMQTLKGYAINAGYSVLALSLMGAILGAW